MKQYSVKYRTFIQGRPVLEKDIVLLSDEEARVYKAAGLISEINDEAPVETGTQPVKTPAKKTAK